jgi:flagellar motor switch protein FliN/FliY
MADTPDIDESNQADLTAGGMLSQAELDSLLAAADAEMQGAEWAGAATAEAEQGEASSAAAPPSPVSLPSFDSHASSHSYPLLNEEDEAVGLSRVRDIPLEVTVELGRTRLLIRDILDLGAGSIIELDKLAGEPVDLFANGLLVARGEVVVIDDNFGVRVTEIITAADRQGGKGANVSAV